MHTKQNSTAFTKNKIKPHLVDTNHRPHQAAEKKTNNIIYIVLTEKILQFYKKYN